MQIPQAPGALIGYRKDGRPIHLLAGGSPDADGVTVVANETPPAPEGAPAGGEDGAPATEPVTEPVGGDGSGAEPPQQPPVEETEPPVEPTTAPEGTDGDDDLAKLSPDKLAKMIRDLRKENASERTNAKQQAAQEAAQKAEEALVQRLGRELGLIKDEEKPPTTEELATQLAAAQQTAAQREADLLTLRRETAAAKAARKHQADPDSLLDSVSFARDLAKLDPSATDFAGTLDALVAKFVEDNPKHKVSGPAPSASSGDFSGGSGDKPPTRQDIDDFRKARRDRSGIDF